MYVAIFKGVGLVPKILYSDRNNIQYFNQEKSSYIKNDLEKKNPNILKLLCISSNKNKIIGYAIQPV